MPIHIDVLAALDERALENTARTMETAFGSMGQAAGESFIGEFSGKMKALSGIFSEMGGASLAIGGIAAGLAVMGKELVDVGDQFERMNRQLLTFTTDSGNRFEEMSRHATDMVAGLDTSMKDLGSTMAILGSRLRAEPGAALDELTHNVMELKDRLGNFDVSQLAGSFKFWGIAIGESNEALATLLETSRRNAVSMQDLVSTMAAAGPNLKELNLGYDQAAELSGRLAAEGLNAAQAVTMLSRAEKAAASQHEDTNTFIRNEIALINQLRDSHQEAAADEEAFLAFGIRNYPLATAAAQDLVNVNKSLPGTFSATTGSMDTFISKTKELSNTWNQFFNDIKAGLAPAGGWVVEGLNKWVEALDRVVNKTKSSDDWVRILVGDAGAWLLGSQPEAKPPAPNPYKDMYPGAFGAPGGPTGVGPGQILGNLGLPGLPAPPSPPPPGPAGKVGPFPGGSPGWVDTGPSPVPGRPSLTEQQEDKEKGKGGGAGKGKGPEAPEIPYGTDFTAPAAGQTAGQYAAQTRVLEAQHRVAEDEARLNQLKASNTQDAGEIQKAQNKLDEDVRAEQQARLQLQQDEQKATETHTSKMREAADGMEELGAKIDQDFGISKGLPGIAENLTKFLANLVAAPVFGALQGANAALGGPTYGAKGLIGAAALGGAFGPQYTPSALAGGGGGGGFGPGGGGGAGGALGGSFGGTAAGGGGPSLWWGGATGPGAAPSGYSGQMGGGSVNASLMSALTAAGIDPGMFPLIQGFARTEGNNPSGVPTLGFTDSQAGASLSGHAAALAAQIKARQAVAGPFPAGGSRQEQAAWMARVVGQAGVQSDWQGNRQPPLQDYIGRIVSGFGPTTWPGYAAGGSSTDTQLAMLTPGEHVLTTQDVSAMGGQSGVYAYRQALHSSAGTENGGGSATGSGPYTKPPQPPPPPSPTKMPGLGSMPKLPAPPNAPQIGPSMIGTIAPSPGYGSGFTVTGGGLVGVAESLPATAAEAGIAAAAAQYGGAVPWGLQYFDAGGSVDVHAGPGGGGGGSPGGAGSGGAPGGSAIGALIGIGMQELNEGISKGAQAAGAIVGGLQQTFGPGQFAQSKLAQTGWISKLVGGIAGAHPQLPNTAGPKQPGEGGLTPEQAAAGGAGGPGTQNVYNGDVHNGSVIIHGDHVSQGSPDDTAKAWYGQQQMAMHGGSSTSNFGN